MSERGVKPISITNSGAGEEANPFDGRYKPHRELITGARLPGLWRTAKAPTAFLTPGIALLLIAGGSLLGCLRVMIVNMSWRSKLSPPPPRHVAGRAARRKAEVRGRRAATRRIDLDVRPEL